MITEAYTTQHGRKTTLVYPDMYAFVCSDVDPPNAALEEITNLYLWGSTLVEEEARGARNIRTIKNAFEVAALCCPELVLKAPFPAGALTPADLTVVDLSHITTFFQSGGGASVPAATDNESGQGTQTDSAGETVGKDAGGVAPPRKPRRVAV